MATVSLQTLHALRGNSKHRSEVEQSLQAIYEDGSGRVPDLSRLERTPSHRFLWSAFLCACVLVFLGGIGWIAFQFVQPFRGFHGSGLAVAIHGASNVTLGAPQVYTIEWSNKDQRALQSAKLRLTLPPDFLLTSLTPPPTNAKLNEWDLGALSVGAEGTIQIQGVFSGALGSQTSLQTIGSYRPATFDRDFQTLAVQPILSSASVLEGRVDIPSKVIAGDFLTIRYTLINQGTQPLRKVIARISPPLGFLPNASQVVSSTEQGFMFVVPELLPRASSTVQLTGSFSSGMAGDLPISLSAGRLGSEGNFILAQKTDTRIPVLAGDLTLGLVVNGSKDARSIKPGEKIHVTLAYQNTSVEPLKKVSLRLNFESFIDGRSVTGTSLLDWGRLQASPVGATSTKPRIQYIRYDKDYVSDLALLDPQAEGRVELSLPTTFIKKGVKDAWLKITADGLVGVVGDTTVQRLVHTQPITLHYRSDATFNAEARYYTEEGAPIGSGPLPPVAGKTTAYRVIWNISKKLHALDQVKVIATLPATAVWGAHSASNAGIVTYDSSTREIKWIIDSVAGDRNEVEANFEVQVTPDVTDVGRFAHILEETKFEAQDSLLYEAMTQTREALTTDLLSDEGARNKGVVRK